MTEPAWNSLKRPQITVNVRAFASFCFLLLILPFIGSHQGMISGGFSASAITEAAVWSVLVSRPTC